MSTKFSSLIVVVVAVVLAACGVGTFDGGGISGAGGQSGGGGAGGSTLGGGGAVTGIPCEVATVLAAKCVSCHGTTPSAGAPYALTTLAELSAAAPGFAGQTVAQRCVARMQATTAPMPPAGSSPATAAEVAAFQTWIAGGMPAGTCASTSGTPTCASNRYYNGGGGRDMDPGRACIACHASISGAEQPPVMTFMGTVFPAYHEQDMCLDPLPATGVQVQLIGANGATLTVAARAASGDFMVDNTAGLTMPYTAKVLANGKSISMVTPQTSGDCNSCHSVAGVNGAPGRVVIPQ